MSGIKELKLFYMDLLKKDGYLPILNDNEVITLEFEGIGYVIELDGEDHSLFCVYSADKLDSYCKNNKDKIELFKILSDINDQQKLVKAYI